MRQGALLVLAALLPSVSALPTEGPAAGPSDPEVTSSVLAAVLSNTTEGGFVLHAASVHLRHYEAGYIRVRTPLDLQDLHTDVEREPPRETSWNLTNATLRSRSQGRPYNFAGLHAEQGSEATLTFEGYPFFEPRQESILLYPQGGPAPEGRPDLRYYYQKVKTPHLYVAGSADLRYEGPFALKVFGYGVHVTSDQGEFDLATGEREDGPLAASARWAYLETPHGTLKMEGTGGRLEAVLTEEASEPSQALASQGQRAALLGGGPFLLPLLGALVATTAAATLARRIRGGRARGAPSGDDVAYHRHYAELAEDLGDFEAAAAWLSGALALAPEDADLARQQMLYLRHAGDLDEAIRLGEKARLCAPKDGMVDYYLAAFYMELGDATKHDQARVHLERALAQEPRLAGTIRGDALFAPLHGTDFRLMLHEASLRAAPPAEGP